MAGDDSHTRTHSDENMCGIWKVSNAIVGSLAWQPLNISFIQRWDLLSSNIYGKRNSLKKKLSEHNIFVIGCWPTIERRYLPIWCRYMSLEESVLFDSVSNVHQYSRINVHLICMDWKFSSAYFKANFIHVIFEWTHSLVAKSFNEIYF